MTQQTITARAKPVREPKPGTRQCGYCGIVQITKAADPEYYCPDCKPQARTLGWLPPINAYICQNCGVQRKGTGRTLCAKCDWNLIGNKPKPEPEPGPQHPCGTYPAYRRHKRRNEEPCQPCNEAMRVYNREWRAGHKRTPEQKAAKKKRDQAQYLRKKGEVA